MNINEALKSEDVLGVRLSCGDRWLYWDYTRGLYIVRAHTYGQRGSSVLIETEDEQAAVAVLVRDGDL